MMIDRYRSSIGTGFDKMLPSVCDNEKQLKKKTRNPAVARIADRTGCL